jgi:hypothetical protein
MPGNYMDWLLQNQAPTPTDRPLLDLNQMPTPDSMAGRLPPELSSYEPGFAEQAVPAVGAFARHMVTAAPEAIYNAVEDPTLANVTKAGLNTALTFGKPLHAGGVLAAGFGGALLDDLGVFDMGAKAGEDPLSPADREEFNRLKKLTKPNPASKARLDELNAILREDARIQAQAKAEAATAGQRLEAEQKSKQTEADREQFIRETTRAENLAAQARARDKNFKDTKVGQFYDEMGGAVPLGMSFIGGGLGRMMHGPAKDWQGYALSAAEGAGGMFAGLNLPLVYDMTTDAYNPRRREIEELAYGLPPTHPRKQEYLDYLKDENALPKENPTRQNATKEFLSGLPGRLAVSAVEGGPLGIAGMAIPATAGRAYKGAQKWGLLPGGRKRSGKPTEELITRTEFEDLMKTLSQGNKPKQLAGPAQASPAIAAPAPAALELAAPTKRASKAKGGGKVNGWSGSTPPGYSDVLRKIREDLDKP